jgi:hypothetical protein
VFGTVDTSRDRADQPDRPGVHRFTNMTALPRDYEATSSGPVIIATRLRRTEMGSDRRLRWKNDAARDECTMNECPPGS